MLHLGCLSFRPSDFRFCSISSEQMDRISPNFVYGLISTRSRVGLLPIIFRAFVIELWHLTDVRILFRISFLLNTFVSWEQMDRISPNFKYALILTRYKLGLLRIFFPHICNRVMPFYSHQNFLSAKYLEYKWTDFHKILIYAFTLTRSKKGLLHIILRTFVTEYWPFIHIMWEFRFRSISWKQMDRISPNFIYVFILTRSRLGFCALFFAYLFQGYGPWFIRILFPLNIFIIN